MSYENAPHTDTALTLEDAAALAGYTVNGFRTTMSKLNKAGNDLRAPARAGERARRYDEDKIKQWIQAGKPVPDPLSSRPSAGAREIPGTAQHVNGTWTATMPEFGNGGTAVAKNLRALHENATALAAQHLGMQAEQISVQLDITAPGDAGARWAGTVEKKDQGQKMISEAIEERQTIIADLKAAGGFTNDDIAAMLGISPQRVQQLSNGARER